MLTRKQMIEARLKKDWHSMQQMAFDFRIELDEIIKDFKRLENDIKGSGNVLLMKPAQCRDCGFIYKNRMKIKTPSKCPECKGERIKHAEFHIES